jgi:peptidoglycan hydrolase-like protein with peptidoglycan-binding domain
VRTFTAPMLTSELSRARAQGWERLCLSAERKASLPVGLLLAIASQETDMNDVVGDGGHGRGLFQIDDRSHTTFLAEQGAAGAGAKPPVAAAARYAAGIVTWGLDYGRKNGVRQADLLKFALSAYNAGAKGALDGYRLGDSDRKTTGGDYGRSVLGRHAIYQRLLGATPVAPLKRGSRNRRVAELKEKLAAWYAKHAPGEWDRFRVNPGPLYGIRVEKLVRDFQRRVGIEVDGVAGKDTFAALAKGKRPKRR